LQIMLGSLPLFNVMSAAQSIGLMQRRREAAEHAQDRVRQPERHRRLHGAPTWRACG
jgi:hypothetical protein